MTTDEFLTTKETLDLLKMDRITVYRMLKDGRLTGIRVGSQWRISRSSVDDLLSGGSTKEIISEPKSSNPFQTTHLIPPDILPIYCVQTLQDVFSEIAQVGAVTVKRDGKPLTTISNMQPFCKLIQSCEKGKAACSNFWRELNEKGGSETQFFQCHAGLQSSSAEIKIGGVFVARLVAGQFYVSAPNPDEERERILKLAEKLGLASNELLTTRLKIQILPESIRLMLGNWLTKMAGTFSHLGHERMDMINRLQQISAMSSYQ